MDVIKDFLQEPHTKKFSSMRVIRALWGVGVLVAWLYVCFNTGTLVALPEGIVDIMGVVLGAGAVQRYLENKEVTKKETKLE